MPHNGVAISFDDGPAPETTLTILELLAKHRGSATFFLNGARAASHPDLVRAIVDEGHDLYGHGWDHIHYDQVGPERLIRDVDRCERYLSRFRPTPSPYLVRLPYTAGHRCAWAHRALRRWRSDVQLAHYSVTLNDWRLAEGCRTYEDVERRTTRAVARLPYEKLPGKVVLLHEVALDVAETAPPALNAAVGPILVKAMLEEFSSRGLRAAKIMPLRRQGIGSRFVLGPRRKIVVAL